MAFTIPFMSFGMDSTSLDEYIKRISEKIREPVTNSLSLTQWKSELFAMIHETGKMKLPSPTLENKPHDSLDPADWPTARTLAHQMLDSSLDHIQFVRERPVWQPMPSDIRRTLEQDPLPEQGQSIAEMYHDTMKYLMPYTKGNIHPRYWGWVTCSGTLVGVLADMISATLNINTGSGTHCSSIIERTVLEWIGQLFGFPKQTAGGFVTSGTSMATVICFAAARQRIMSDVRETGLLGGPQLVAYGSTEAHGCVVKALELLGLGSAAFHAIPVDQNFSMNIEELKLTIEKDRKNGLVPFCLVGNAGTVNTGAFDNLRALSVVARDEGIWFHVDGAFGSLVILDPQRRDLVSGIEEADSLAFDFHKWLHCPYDAGCVLVRDITHLRATFARHQSYLAKPDRGCTGDLPAFFDLGPELSRSSRALKVWLTLKTYGTRRFGEKIADNCEQAQYLVSLLERHPEIISIVQPVTLNVVNFRFEPETWDRSDHVSMDDFNRELVADIQLSGVAVPSLTVIHGRVYIRVCLVSHRSTMEDVDVFLDIVFKMYHRRLEALSNGSA